MAVGALQIFTAFLQGTTGTFTFDNLVSGTGDPVTAADGSIIVPSFPDNATCYLEELWCAADEAGIVSLSGPDFIDRELGYEAIAASNVDGGGAFKAQNVSPGTLSARLHPGNQFFARFANSTAGKNVNLTGILRFSDLPGIQARLATAQAIKANAGKIVGMQVTVDPSSVAQGNWSDQVSLTATEGRKLDGTKYYAIVGFTSVAPLAAIAVSGYETGQLKIGAATVGESEHDTYSLLDIGMRYQDALIPVFKGYNQDQIMVQAADPAAGSTLACVELVEVPQSVYDLSQATNSP
jgi:hypothetical protein